MVTRGEGCREGIVTKFGIDMYTLLFLKWITKDFPGYPKVKALFVPRRGHRPDP